MDKSVYSNTALPDAMDPPDPQLQTPRAVSPVPSCVSMKSDWSMGKPPNFSRDPPQSDPELQTPRVVSPVPSCVSMKSDWSMGKPPNFSREPPQSDPKLQVPRAVSPVPSDVSMRSDWSKGDPPNFSRDPPQSDPKLQTPRAVYPVPSDVSMRSDWSKGDPPNFSRDPPLSDPKLQVPRAVSPVPSDVSMKSDWSKGDPPNFSRDPPQSDPKLQTPRAVSPVPSGVSMKSDWSKGKPPNFNREPPQSDSKCQPPRSVFPVPSHMSMKGDCSMELPPAFSGVPPHPKKRWRPQCGTTITTSEVGKHPLYPHTRFGQIFVQPSVTEQTAGTNHVQSEDPPVKKAKLQDDNMLNKVLKRHKANMKKRFENICEGIIRPGAQTLLNKIYTELYITEGESEGVNKEHEVWQVEAASRPQTTDDTAINCNDIFKPLAGQEGHIRTVMTKGIAGIGKTVSVQKFIMDWAEENANQDVDFMFVLPFRELNLVKHDQYSLHRLLLDFHPELRRLENAEYRDCNIVFIFDGLDESRLSLNFQENQELFDVTQTASVDVLMTSLIQGSLLPSALIWITSRPAAAHQIPSQCVNLVTEVRGFNDPQKEEYFQKRISDENKANRIISHIKATRSLHIMCYMPVFCWIAATVLQLILEQGGRKETPKTLTEMFIHFLRIQTTRKDQKYKDNAEIDRLLESHKDVILKLAELASTHLEDGNLMFYEEDLRRCGIDVSEASVYSGMCTEIFREECVFDHQKVYCFVHLSIQEFLAALHVLTSYLNENLKALGQSLDRKANTSTVPLDEMLKSAMNKALESKNGHLDLFVRFLHGISLESNQKLLHGLLPHTHSCPESVKRTIRNLKVMLRPDISPERCINLYHCLVEMHDSSVYDDVQAFLRKESSEQPLTPAMCSALAHEILASDEVLDEFDLMKFNTISEARWRLIPAVRHCRKAIISGCKLNEPSINSVLSALQSANSPLRELDLSQTDLHKSGEKLLSALQNPLCKLETLRLAGCKLTDESYEAAASALQSCASLTELDLCDNQMNVCGVQLLHTALSHPNCKLQTLRLSPNSISDDGCVWLAFTLMSDPSCLKKLDMGSSSAEGPAQKLLLDTFKDPHRKVEHIRLAGCKLQEQQCEVVASAVQCMESLRDLDLSGNYMSVTGANLLKAALCNPSSKLKILRLAGCKLTEQSCEGIASAVQSCVSLTEVDLSGNDMSVTGAQLLNAALCNPSCKLKILRLAGCKLTEQPCEVILSAVQSCVSLTELDLSENYMSLSGIQLLNAALCNPSCKLTILRLAGCKLTEQPCEVILSAVQSCVSLTELDLSENYMSLSGIQLLNAALCNPSCKLTILRLAGCKLTEQPCEVIASAVQSCVSLTELDLSENYMSLSGIQLLNAALRYLNMQKLRYHHGDNGRIKPELRKYACDLTLDPNTANRDLSLSEGNRKVTRGEQQPYPVHPDRFDSYAQVLCREGLSGRCYWEAEWSGDRADIAVAYKIIKRKGSGNEGCFGYNDKSWSLQCYSNRYTASHNNKSTDILAPSPHSSRVGVYLDWPAGTLSFYSVSSDTLTHLHTFHSTFTEPLYPGFGFGKGSSVSLCQIISAPHPTGTPESTESSHTPLQSPLDSTSNIDV